MPRRFEWAALVAVWVSLPVLAAPRLERGVLDLREYDLERDGPVVLDGTWRFAWNSVSCDVAAAASPQPTGYWDTTSSIGAGTYSVRVLVSPGTPPLGLCGGYFMTSARVRERSADWLAR